MRSLLLKATFAAVLGVLLLSPSAHADRQGGGTLMVVRTSDAANFVNITGLKIPEFNASFDVNASTGEFVRFKTAKGDKITFDYSWFVGADKGLAEVTLDKAKASEQRADLIRALLDSKAKADWEAIK
jgi:hypothetical protein